MAEISAWDIYWVLQLDSINVVVFILAFGGSIGTALFWLSGALFLDLAVKFPELASSKQEAATGRAQVRVAKRMAAALIPIFVLAALLPSTKTAAAMYVIPAVANNETLRKEAGELYGLAKDALKDAVGHEEKSK